MKKAIWFAIAILLIVASPPTFSAEENEKDSKGSAKDSESTSSIEKMVKASELIYIVKYLEYETPKNSPKPAWPIARYYIVDSLKGPKVGALPRIHYELPHVKKSDIKKLRIKASMMPREGSKWILFIPNVEQSNGAFETYSGAQGRLPFTSENLDAVLLVIDKLERQSNSQQTSSSVDPAIEKMINASDTIYIGEYKGYEGTGKISEKNPPRAIFRIVQMLKGAKLGSIPFVRYQFAETDKSGSTGWKFEESMMPEKGSKWILFIPEAIPIDGAFETYGGATGRVPYSENNLNLILKIIDKSKSLRQSSNDKKKMGSISFRERYLMQRWDNLPTRDPVIILGIDDTETTIMLMGD